MTDVWHSRNGLSIKGMDKQATFLWTNTGVRDYLILHLYELVMMDLVGVQFDFVDSSQCCYFSCNIIANAA